MDPREKLILEMNQDADLWFKCGKWNNIWDIVFTISTVLTSLIASVLAGASEYKLLLASVAAVPAALATIQRSVSFRNRSLWYFSAGSRMRALRFRVQHSRSPDLEKFAQLRGDLEIEIEREWAQRVYAGLDDERVKWIEARTAGPRAAS